MAGIYEAMTLITPPAPAPITLWLHMAAVMSFAIAMMFLYRTRPILGKKDGVIPLWSYIIFAPFHIPSLLYTAVHSFVSPVPYASEVLPGFWVGSKYGDRITQVKKWDLTVDITCEFTESCLDTTTKYVNIPVWDGTPPSTAQIEEAATAVANAWKHDKKTDKFTGTVMVHCAHGRGRSCMISCAGLVKAGYCATWEEAFEVVKKGRSCVKLNSSMRKGLDAWVKSSK
jgi:rhodanese-related sulfurtransferase